MTIEHHPGDDLLLAYGAGTLDEATSLLVATHLALCPRCRNRLALAESIGGELMNRRRANGTVDETGIDSAMALAPGDDEPAGPATAESGPFLLPQPLRGYAGGDAAELGWRAVGGGIRQIRLKTPGKGAKARLLSITAGTRVPEHSHGGEELTLVLAGSLYDRGEWYRRGDVDMADASVLHRPAAGPEEDCICLAVADARLKFSGVIPRLLQPFNGF